MVSVSAVFFAQWRWCARYLDRDQGFHRVLGNIPALILTGTAKERGPGRSTRAHPSSKSSKTRFVLQGLALHCQAKQRWLLRDGLVGFSRPSCPSPATALPNYAGVQASDGGAGVTTNSGSISGKLISTRSLLGHANRCTTMNCPIQAPMQSVAVTRLIGALLIA